MISIEKYILKRNQILHFSNEITLTRFFRESMEKLNIYRVADGNTDRILFIRISDGSFFDQYHKTFKYLHESKTYFVWYKLFHKEVKKGRHRHSRTKSEYILKRDGYACVVCKGKENLTVDHLKPWSKYRDESFYNLITMCKDCNNQKGEADWGEHFINDVVVPHIKRVSIQSQSILLNP